MAKVIHLSEATYLAMHALAIIGVKKDRVSVRQLAEMTGTSENHLSKVMQMLAKSGYVASTRGPAGGFVLKKKTANITLLEIYELFEGKIENKKCPFHKSKCPFSKCLFSGVINDLQTQFLNYLRSNTLQDFISTETIK